MARRVFYSFHYEEDHWRASQVRNMGVIEGNRPATDNDWETVKSGRDPAIKKWIAEQMSGRSCTVVLVGKNTVGRKWIDHEIVESWNNRMGVVGIHIHGLRDQDTQTAAKGRNPFNSISYGKSGATLASIVKCYDPQGHNSQDRYDWIKTYLADAVEEAISIRRNH